MTKDFDGGSRLTNESSIASCDLLLVAVTKVEIEAVLEASKSATGRSPATIRGRFKTYFDLGEMEGTRVFAVRSEMGSDTIGGSLSTIQKAIQEVSPSAIVMVGIAFGVDDEKQNFGDILVSHQLQMYELQRIGTDDDGERTITLRGDKVTASVRLLDRLRTTDLSWNGGSVHFGLVLSGQKLVDNRDYCEQLARLMPEAIGGEMEGAGLYTACQQEKVDWIVVKSICDWADGHKRYNKDNQQLKAAQQASEFVIKAIMEGGLAENPNGPGARIRNSVLLQRDSKLIRRVSDVSSDSALGVGFDRILSDFANRVVPELSSINLLFDEYAPHDGTNIASLFRIADELLGDTGIASFNGCEACVLACAIYSHDWGMAVSSDERELIITGKVPNELKGSEFTLLPDEAERWNRYARSAGVRLNESDQIVEPSSVPKDVWREYVRLTFSERSRAKVIKYFADVSEPMGNLVGEICAAEWYDISKVREMRSAMSVDGIATNPQALAIYMRLIDLLHIGGNRTPYSLWKYVNHPDSLSAPIWKKYRVLSQAAFVAATESNPCRQILINGQTGDYKVFAALKDLQRVLSSKLEENELILTGLGTYSLGAFQLQWNVDPIGFEPIDIRFVFDRTQMFELVSGEIYEGDPYVFLRELLQNSIDATMVRHLRYQMDGTSSLTVPSIRVQVDHGTNGDATVSVVDQGTGMDIRIVRDYLAVVGKSYYRSTEFGDLEIDMTPISRFGVGLLSCFEVADSILLETQTDPKFGTTEALRIDIADRAQQFRVERIPLNSSSIGTKVTVHVLGFKWRKDKFVNDPRLHVTEYLKSVIGFVPFPVHISEGGTETVLVDPNASATKVEQINKVFPTAAVWQESLGFDLTEVVVPQDRSHARCCYEGRIRKFRETSGEIRLTGAIAYFVPNDQIIGSWRKVSGSGTGSTVFLRQGDQLIQTQIRWTPNNANAEQTGISDSAKRTLFSRVYLRGILLPAVDLAPKGGGDVGAPPPRVTINIDCDAKTMVPVLSRRGVRKSLNSVRDTISSVFHSEIRERYGQQFYKADPMERLILMGRLARYVANPVELERCFEIDEWPIAFFDQTGKKSVCLLQNLPANVEIAPKFFMRERRSWSTMWSPKEWFHEPFANAHDLMSSEDSRLYVTDSGFDYDDGSPMEWNTMDHCASHALGKRFRLAGIRIGGVCPSRYIVRRWERGEVLSRKQSSCFWTQDIDFQPFDECSSEVLCVLPLRNDQISQNYVHDMIYNSNHPAATVLERTLCAMEAQVDDLDAIVAGQLRDAYCSLRLIGHGFPNYTPGPLEREIAVWVPSFCRTVAQFGLIDLSIEDNAVFSQSLTVFTCLE